MLAALRGVDNSQSTTAAFTTALKVGTGDLGQKEP